MKLKHFFFIGIIDQLFYYLENDEADDVAETELRDATVKLLRLLANLSIDDTVGSTLACKNQTISVRIYFRRIIKKILKFIMKLIQFVDFVGFIALCERIEGSRRAASECHCGIDQHHLLCLSGWRV